jgi:ELWxxDGT repeat protein
VTTVVNRIRYRFGFLVLLAVLAGNASVHGQGQYDVWRLRDGVVERAFDIRPGREGASPSFLTVFQDRLFLVADDGSGRDLWSYDGANAPQKHSDTNAGFMQISRQFGDELLFIVGPGNRMWRYGVNGSEILPGAEAIGIASAPGPGVLDGEVIFLGHTPATGLELFRYDGSNVSLVREIQPGPSYPDIGGFIRFNDELFFAVRTNEFGREPWRYRNGTVELLADIGPSGPGTSSHSNPHGYEIHDGYLYFVATTPATGPELYRYDGTSVVAMPELHPGAPWNGNFHDLVSLNDELLVFDARSDRIWTFDGDSYIPLSDQIPSQRQVRIGTNLSVARYNGGLVFTGFNDNEELWFYDGTDVTLLGDLNPSGHSRPRLMTVIDDVLYFVADDGATGEELWRYDGATISQVVDLFPGADSSQPGGMIGFQGDVYWVARAVPEPSTISLVIVAFLAFALYSARSLRKQRPA